MAVYRIICDHFGCPESLDMDDDHLPIRTGWRIDGEFAYCPRHVPADELSRLARR